MKLLVDMNLSPRWVPFLAASQLQAVHWSTVGPVKATDTDIMAHAREHGHVVLKNISTSARFWRRLMEQSRVWCRSDPMISARIQSVCQLSTL
jgi:predicted nuclease of predicted toxin-antitoxin system